MFVTQRYEHLDVEFANVCSIIVITCFFMDEFVTSIVEWFLSLGDKYGVNPVIFGSIYVGAIPFFTASVAWLVRNYRKGKSIILPALLSGLFFVSSYLYLIIAGQNVPWWVYVFMVVLILGGGYSTVTKIKTKLNHDVTLDE